MQQEFVSSSRIKSEVRWSDHLPTIPYHKIRIEGQKKIEAKTGGENKENSVNSNETIHKKPKLQKGCKL